MLYRVREKTRSRFFATPTSSAVDINLSISVLKSWIQIELQIIVFIIFKEFSNFIQIAVAGDEETMDTNQVNDLQDTSCIKGTRMLNV